MRMAMIMISLAAIAVGLVHSRRDEMDARHEIQRLRLDRVAIRRALSDQEVRIGVLTSHGRLSEEAAALNFPPGQSSSRLAADNASRRLYRQRRLRLP